jgi:hypothetical protein
MTQALNAHMNNKKPKINKSSDIPVALSILATLILVSKFHLHQRVSGLLRKMVISRAGVRKVQEELDILCQEVRKSSKNNGKVSKRQQEPLARPEHQKNELKLSG